MHVFVDGGGDGLERHRVDRVFRQWGARPTAHPSCDRLREPRRHTGRWSDGDARTAGRWTRGRGGHRFQRWLPAHHVSGWRRRRRGNVWRDGGEAGRAGCGRRGRGRVPTAHGSASAARKCASCKVRIRRDIRPHGDDRVGAAEYGHARSVGEVMADEGSVSTSCGERPRARRSRIARPPERFASRLPAASQTRGAWQNEGGGQPSDS